MTLTDLQNIVLISFKDTAVLADGHTLAACEYYDNWRVFPEDGEECLIARFMDVGDAISDDWPGFVKEEILWEIKNKIVFNKTYNFMSVDSEYLELFCFGTPYLSEQEFCFYLCAWIVRVGDDSIDSKNFINGVFFDEIKSVFDGRRKSKIASLSECQRKAISSFLYYVVENKLNSFDVAEDCLKIGWCNYLQ